SVPRDGTGLDRPDRRQGTPARRPSNTHNRMMPSASALRTTLLPLFALGLGALLAACDGGQIPLDASVAAEAQPEPEAAAQASSARVAASAVAVNAVATAAPTTPIMFVTQVPTSGDIFAGRLASFANHLTGMTSTP